MLILTPDEIRELTGYTQPAKQLAELHRRGFVRAYRNRLGQVTLERAHFEAVEAGTYGAKAEPPAHTEPPGWNPWIAHGIAPGEWMRENWPSFVVTPQQCLSGSRPPGEVPDTSGLYFLLLAGHLVYVGETTSTERRFEQHALGKDFDAAHAVRLPDFFRRDIERAYITALQPPLNQKVQPPGRLFSAMIAALRREWAGFLPMPPS